MISRQRKIRKLAFRIIINKIRIIIRFLVNFIPINAHNNYHLISIPKKNSTLETFIKHL